MVDQQTAIFLRSTHREPSQGDLDQAVGQATRVRVSELVFRDGVGRFELRFDICEPAKVRAFQAALRIEPTDAHLMSSPTHQIECFTGESLIARIDMVATYVLRWPDRWQADAAIVNADAVADFFASQGDHTVRQALDESRGRATTQARQRAIWEQSWTAATPQGLSPFMAELEAERYASVHTIRDRAIGALAQTHETRDAQILALLRWYGHSLGPWSGYPIAETVPEYLLEAFGNDAVIGAIQRDDLSRHQLEGAARFLCRGVHPQHRPRRRTRIPPEVRQRLWSHLESSGDTSKLLRAKRFLTPDDHSSS